MGILLGFALNNISAAHALSAVVNPHVSASSVPLETARAIFSMRQLTWPDGKPVKVFVLADTHPLHKAFCKKELHMFPHQLRRIWDRLIYSGTGQAPTEVSSVTEMRYKIAHTPGSIGYLNEEFINESMRVLDVD